jgi:hypothetical protein
MVRRVLALIAALVLASAAQGGAWLKERGDTFLSFSFEAPQDGEGWASVYAERGIRPWLTFGVDGGRAAGRGEGEVIVFARTMVGPQGEARRQALELGFGARLDAEGVPLPAMRAGLSWGRGFGSRFGNGWMAVDGSVTGYGNFAAGSEEGLSLKLDTTFGLRPSENSVATMQFFWSRSGDEDAAMRLVPSYGRRLTGSTFGRVGVVFGGGGAPSLGLKVGITTEF